MLAVHVRRGDVVRIVRRATPPGVFVAAVESALRGVAAVDPAARVGIVVLSQLECRTGRDKRTDELERLELLDEPVASSSGTSDKGPVGTLGSATPR